jgi:hypothetical protein
MLCKWVEGRFLGLDIVSWAGQEALRQDDVEGYDVLSGVGGGRRGELEYRGSKRDSVLKQFPLTRLGAITINNKEKRRTTEGDILKPADIGLAGITHNSGFDPRSIEDPEAEA